MFDFALLFNTYEMRVSAGLVRSLFSDHFALGECTVLVKKIQLERKRYCLPDNEKEE